MKIKTTKQMRLDELIKYGIENNWESVQATSDKGYDVYFTSDNRFLINETTGPYGIKLNDTFAVEVEEEQEAVKWKH